MIEAWLVEERDDGTEWVWLENVRAPFEEYLEFVLKLEEDMEGRWDG